ncbi:MAG: hypothetical protein ACRDJL_11080 [Actinomycetota bacterium]
MASLVAGLLPALGPQPRARAQTSPAPQRVELTSERSRYAKVFLNPDGTRTAEIFTDPIHYQTESGSFEEIDNTVIEQPDGRGFEKAAGDLEVDFAALGQSEELVSLAEGNSSLSFGLEGGEAVEPVTEDDSITYPEILPGADLRFELSGEEIKEKLVLQGPPPGDEEELVLRFPIDTEGLEIERRASGDIVFTRAGEVTFAMAKLYMWDSAIDEASGEKTMSEATRANR